MAQPADKTPRRPRPPTDYTPEQNAALDRLAQIIAGALERQLDEQRPDLARRIKSV